MEQLLHYIWKHKIFPLQELKTTTGQKVEIIDTGLANTNAGPDFFNAKVKLNGILWIGNVEIHERSSDWLKHGHHTDATYDSVILHITSDADIDVHRTNGEPIPQLILTCPDYVCRNYHELVETESYHPHPFHFYDTLLDVCPATGTFRTESLATIGTAQTLQQQLGRCLFHYFGTQFRLWPQRRCF